MDGADYLALGIFIGLALVLAPIIAWRGFFRRDTVGRELRRFFGSDPGKLSIVSRKFASVDLANLQRAIERIAESGGATRRVIGYATQGMGNSLQSLIDSGIFTQTKTAPPVMREVDVDVDQKLQCVENGLHLIDGPKGKLVVNVGQSMFERELRLEVLAPHCDSASDFIEQVRDEIARNNVFRRKILSLESNSGECGEGSCNVCFHRFPAIGRDEIILSEETLSLLERNTVGFFRHAAALRDSGRSVKRGLLLHGKPGTGKTYTAKWLAQSLEGVTVILLSGEQLGLIKQCCELARMLAPALVIMEDVDLVATARNKRRPPVYQVTLHQLLNEMDGLTSEAEVLFLLTTNRPDVLEEALAGRPGRVDQAIEYPLPDEECRQRLLRLFGRGLQLDLALPEHIVGKTEGASPAFLRELVRKAALFAAEEQSKSNGRLHVTDRHLDAALRELVLGGGELTRQLFGFAGGPLV